MMKFDLSYKYDANNVKFIIYKDESKIYYVPYFGIIPKIIDFGFSILPEENVYSDIIKNRFAMNIRFKNDLIRLFSDIYDILRNKDADNLLNILEPNNTYIHMNPGIIKNIKNIPSEKDMVYNSIWDEYRVEVKNLQPNNIYETFSLSLETGSVRQNK